MQIVPGTAADQYHLKFVLMQSGKSSGTVSGYLSITIDGLQQGRPQSLSFEQVAPAGPSRLSYSFRYFQDYDEPLQLPTGFEPTRIGVELHIGRDTNHSFRQAFVWKAQGMSVETDAATGTQAKGAINVQAQTE